MKATFKDLPAYLEAMQARDWQQCDIIAEELFADKIGDKNMSIKKGDCVVNFSELENLVSIGYVSSEPNDTDEHDLDFIDGGSVSPVNTSESFVVPENFAKWLNRILPIAEV